MPPPQVFNFSFEMHMECKTCFKSIYVLRPAKSQVTLDRRSPFFIEENKKQFAGRILEAIMSLFHATFQLTVNVLRCHQNHFALQKVRENRYLSLHTFDSCPVREIWFANQKLPVINIYLSP